jgi:hypothetical protein
MTTEQATKGSSKEGLLLHLLNASLENDAAEIESYNLPQNTQLALAAMVATYREHDALQDIVDRTEASMAERQAELDIREDLLRVLLQQMP